MNTTTAATQANVTVATIRTWCRRGVIAATKTAGKWVIDTTSLAHRIAIGTMKRTAHKVVELTADTLTAIGGRRWQKNGMDRIYFNNARDLLGLQVSHYKSGNISSAWLDDESISNSEAGRIAAATDKVFYDLTTNKLRIQGYGTPRSLTLDEMRDRILTGLRTAVAAL
ncbi:hypothetical protein [Streptomyces sp. NPDC047981]|uniref:hypothetical protein n=1 Tax=Streptomyces sp. NPDC047981 TaxID=3154610 RepID=UPI0034344B91